MTFINLHLSGSVEEGLLASGTSTSARHETVFDCSRLPFYYYRPFGVPNVIGPCFRLVLQRIAGVDIGQALARPIALGWLLVSRPTGHEVAWEGTVRRIKGGGRRAQCCLSYDDHEPRSLWDICKGIGIARCGQWNETEFTRAIGVAGRLQQALAWAGYYFIL